MGIPQQTMCNVGIAILEHLPTSLDDRLDDQLHFVTGTDASESVFTLNLVTN